MVYTLYVYSVGNSDICWYIAQLSFSFQGSSSFEKVAPPSSIFWDVSAQDYYGAGGSSNAVVTKKHTVVLWFLVW